MEGAAAMGADVASFNADVAVVRRGGGRCAGWWTQQVDRLMGLLLLLLVL